MYCGRNARYPSTSSTEVWIAYSPYFVDNLRPLIRECSGGFPGYYLPGVARRLQYLGNAGLMQTHTTMAAFTAGVPVVDLDELAPCPRRFLVKLAHQLSPANITYGLDEWRFLTMFLTCELSAAITWFLLTICRVSLCRWSSHVSAILA